MIVVLRPHSPNFKALDIPWTRPFKRYFLGHFVEYSAIFSSLLIKTQFTKVLVPGLGWYGTLLHALNF